MTDPRNEDAGLVEQAISLGHEIAATHGEGAQLLIDTLATRLESPVAENARLLEALTSINLMTSPGNRTLDEMIRDMGWANDRARAALGESR